MRDQVIARLRGLARRWPGPLAVAMLSLILIPLACQNRGSAPASPVVVARGPAQPSSVPAAPGGTPLSPSSTSGPAVRVLPTLATEPEIGVLLKSGGRVEFTLLVGGRSGSIMFAPGVYVAEASSAGMTINGAPFPADCTLELADAGGAPRFMAELTPPFGKAQRLQFSGTPTLHCERGRVELIERVALETYLAGVLPTEMVPSWPVEALKAQAVAARSYACAHYLERFDAPWQLHWHYSRDMAYGGCPTRSYDGVRRALAETRGWILEYRGDAVPALFHASSGGRTESAVNIWPTLRAADGSPMAAAMPVVDDASAQGGATALKMRDTHWQWKVDVRLSEVTAGLAEWSRDHPEARLVVGTVLEVRPGKRFADSGRIATVSIRQRVGRKETITTMPAQDFRMAVGPGVIRSTWWDRCVTVGAKGGTLVISGRGFGHGVGLSQVSAWRMAKDGARSEDILARFYPHCVAVRKWMP